MHFQFNQKITLENDRSRLEPLTMRHIDELLPIALKYPNLLQYSPSLFGTAAHLQAYIETALAARERKERYPFAIFDKSKKAYAGSTSFGNISNKNSRLEIGWTWLGKDFQGTGLNQSNKHLMLQYAFEKLDAKRVELKTDARNKASRRAMEKIGGQYEGCLRSHTLMTDGHRRDTVYYGLLQENWKVIQKEFFKDFLD